jgi:hypothetical protein
VKESPPLESHSSQSRSSICGGGGDDDDDDEAIVMELLFKNCTARA